MDIDFVFRIAGIIALLATLSGLVVVLMMVVGMISDFFSSIRSLLQI